MSSTKTKPTIDLAKGFVTQVEWYKILSLRFALKVHPIRMSSKVPAATTLGRRTLGLKGNAARMLKDIDSLIEHIKQENNA